MTTRVFSATELQQMAASIAEPMDCVPDVVPMLRQAARDREALEGMRAWLTSEIDELSAWTLTPIGEAKVANLRIALAALDRLTEPQEQPCHEREMGTGRHRRG